MQSRHPRDFSERKSGFECNGTPCAMTSGIASPLAGRKLGATAYPLPHPLMGEGWRLGVEGLVRGRNARSPVSQKAAQAARRRGRRDQVGRSRPLVSGPLGPTDCESCCHASCVPDVLVSIESGRLRRTGPQSLGGFGSRSFGPRAYRHHAKGHSRRTPQSALCRRTGAFGFFASPLMRQRATRRHDSEMPLGVQETGFRGQSSGFRVADLSGP